jgi:hypothetical protein
MNGAEYIQLLNNTERANTKELENLLEIAPWFQGARILLLKKYHEENHPAFDSFLRMCAIHAPDRSRLYQLIYQHPLREKILETAYDITSNENTEKPSQISDSEFVENIEIAPIAITRLGKKIPKVEESELAELEEQILEQAFVSEYVIEDKKKQDNEKLIFESESPKSNKAEMPKPTKDKQSFSEWLKILDEKRLDDLRKKESTPKNKKEKQLNIIERFIQEEPKISKADKASFFSPSDLAKMSLVENDDFVTETLAKVYAKQGNFIKAQSIYEKLMLKYPEKKNYFADRIFHLQEENKKNE